MTRPVGRTLVVTYCCRDKDPAPELLPAVVRYLSPRIRVAASAACERGWAFLILSGRFGLIAPDHPTPHYDHLLTEGEIPGHAAAAADRLAGMEVDRVVFVSRTLAEDPGTGPYREVMVQACQRAGSRFEVLEIGPGDPGPDLLVDLD